MLQRGEILPESLLIGCTDEEGVNKRDGRLDRFEGSSVVHLCALFVSQEDRDPTGLTHVESVGLITTWHDLIGSIVKESACKRLPQSERKALMLLAIVAATQLIHVD